MGSGRIAILYCMGCENGLSVIRVVKRPVYGDPALNDGDPVARVVVAPTGLFGLGRPFYVRDFDGVSPVEPGFKVKVVKKSVVLWADAEHSYDKIVNGFLAEKVRVKPEDPPKPDKPFEFDIEE